MRSRQSSADRCMCTHRHKITAAIAASLDPEVEKKVRYEELSFIEEIQNKICATREDTPHD